MTPLKPYRRTKNKLFFKKNGKKMIVERKSIGEYTFTGTLILDTPLEIYFDVKAEALIKMHE